MQNYAWIFTSLIAAAALGAFGVTPLNAEDVRPGIDLWGTHERGTKAKVDAPSDFFDDGSDALVGVEIDLVGWPLPNLGGPFRPSLGQADTVVERLDEATLPECGSSAEIDIQIVALSLMSTSPITVSYDGGSRSELWDVQVCLSDEEQGVGTMTITQNCEDGGIYTSNLLVSPKFVFTRRTDLEMRVLDPGQAGAIPLVVDDGFWVHTPDPGLDVTRATRGAITDGNCDGVADPEMPATSNFAPGISVSPCDCSSQKTSAYSTQLLQITADEPEGGWTEEQCATHYVAPATPDDIAYAPGHRPLMPWEEPEKAWAADRPSLAGAAVTALLALVFALAVAAPRKRSSKDETGDRA